MFLPMIIAKLLGAISGLNISFPRLDALRFIRFWLINAKDLLVFKRNILYSFYIIKLHGFDIISAWKPIYWRRDLLLPKMITATIYQIMTVHSVTQFITSPCKFYKEMGSTKCLMDHAL